MTSLLTNSTALTTLRQMSATQKDMRQAEAQVSTGLRVGGAADNAAYWSIGVAMRSRVGAVSAVNEGIALTSSIAMVTADALAAILVQMNGIKDALVAARQPGVDAAAVDLAIKAKQQQIITIANSASFNGRNWLVDQIKVDETIDKTTTYDQSASVVRRVGANASPATEGYGVVDAAHESYTITDQLGGTQVLDRDTSASVTWTDTVTTAGGVTQRHLTAQAGARTDSAPSGGIAGATTPITLLEGYDASSGLATATLSRAPLLLFTNNSGTVRDTDMVVYSDATLDANLSAYGAHEHPLSVSQSASYAIDTVGASPGLLDHAMTVGNGAGNRTTLLTMTAVGAGEGDLATMLQATDAAIAGLTTAGAVMGALTTRIEGQASFNTALSDALTAGIGALTDGDMDAAATRIQALRTQQQLQVQALSIANQDSAMILKLFG